MKRAPLGALAALLLIHLPAFAQVGMAPDIPEAPDAPSWEANLEEAMRARVSAEFPDTAALRFRNVKRIRTEAGSEVEFCGQVSVVEPGEPQLGYRIFMYSRTGEVENAQILGAEALNGYRVGRKLIRALKRVGCI